MQYRGLGWSFDTHGWTVTDDGEVLALSPMDADAALILSTFRKERGIIGDGELRAIADRACPRDALRSAVNCGDFWGYQAQYIAYGTSWRVWWLARSDVHIHASYNVHLDYAGRHDNVLDRILGSLHVEAP